MTVFHFIRHEESEGNAAAKLAKLTGALRLDIPWDTFAIPLTKDGQAKAARIKVPAHDWVYVSPNLRAYQTFQIALPTTERYSVDGRLVDKNSGSFDKLSIAGIQKLYPKEWAERERVGKFFHRPPGGESWLDVIERTWEFMDDVLTFNHESVVVIGHDIPILAAIYIANDLTPDEIMRYHKETPVLNGSITTITYEGRPHADIRRTLPAVAAG